MGLNGNVVDPNKEVRVCVLRSFIKSFGNFASQMPQPKV